VATTVSKTLSQLQDRLQTVSNEYQKLQNELSAAVDKRQKLDAQLQENKMVQKEFVSLTPQNTIYKLVGPVLVQQDSAEAKSNVEKRLDFINGEIKRTEDQLLELNEKSEKKKLEIVEAQTSIQKLQQPPAGKPAAAIAA